MQSTAIQSSGAGELSLAQRVFEALQAYRVHSLRHVRIESAGGAIVLRGEVNSFYAKQILQHNARRVAGDSQVIDEVSVVTPAAYRDPLRLARAATAGVGLLLALLLVGCTEEPTRVPTFPVTGVVTITGQPAVGAVVIFHPKQSTGEYPLPRGTVDGNGKFEVTTFATADGAPVGEYVVTVEWTKLERRDDEFVPGPSLVPPKYTTVETSDLVARVAEGPNDVPINIVR